MLLALAAPPFLPSAFAAGSLPSSIGSDSVSSPVAMRMTLTALPMTSAGRFSPLGPAASVFLFRLEVRTKRKAASQKSARARYAARSLRIVRIGGLRHEQLTPMRPSASSISSLVFGTCDLHALGVKHSQVGDRGDASARQNTCGFQTETLPPGATMKRCLTFLKARKGAARITAG